MNFKSIFAMHVSNCILLALYLLNFSLLSAQQNNSPSLDHKVVYSDETEERTRALSLTIFSPFCPGRTLGDCPSSAASELRNKISAMISAGKSDSEIMIELFALYGEQIRAAPKLEGFGWFGWFAPAIFFILGLLVVAIWLRYNSRDKTTSSDRLIIDKNLEKKIEAEIRYR